MQNSLDRNLKFNLDNFNREFEEKINSSEELDNYDVNNKFDKPFGTDDMIKDNNIINLSIGNIILELRDMFFIILELVTKQVNPYGYLDSSPKRKFIFGLFLIVFGCLLLLLSNLMMEPKVI